jgi:hypothetical protein
MGLIHKTTWATSFDRFRLIRHTYHANHRFIPNRVDFQERQVQMDPSRLVYIGMP